MAFEIITQPACEPLTVLQVCEHLRINAYDSEIDEALNSYVDVLITAVRQDVEDFLGRALITQTCRYYLDCWPSLDYIELPKPPIQSVTSVKYTDSDGTETTWNVPDTGEYIVDTLNFKGRITLGYNKYYPTATLYPSNPIKIEFVCGYGNAPEDVPRRIIQAMLIQIAELYENRETVVIGQTINKLDTVERLLWPYVVVPV